MAIAERDLKLLWGRAGGRCSNPGCREELTFVPEDGANFHVGEMAHLIAQQPRGPRGVDGGGANTYDNLILLCPLCHTKVDKSPNNYPIELLLRWKAEREDEVSSVGTVPLFEVFDDLKKAVSLVLAENRALWEHLGPNSAEAASNPASNLHRLWTLRKLDTIIPNNRRAIALLNANADLLPEGLLGDFALFQAHTAAFEENQYGRLEAYPLFPQSFARWFS